jgi:hypothetical protein
MYLFIEVLFPLVGGEKYNIYKLGFGLIYWSLGGLGFGYAVKKFIFRQGSKQSKDETQQAT